MTDQELKDLVASLAVNQKETAQDIRELRASEQEARQQMQKFREGMEQQRAIQQEEARHRCKNSAKAWRKCGPSRKKRPGK